MQKATDLALAGDTTALRLCLERVCPPRKDVPAQIDLPVIGTAKEAADAARAVLRAVSEAQISAFEAAAIMALIDQYRRTLELTELEARIAKLEATI
jgi:hypothetical protein